MPLSELGEAALSYVGMGLAVIPLRPRGKEPMTAHGLNDWTDDPESVRAVWGRYPDANVGIVCGAPSGGLVVLDLDSHEGGPEGYETLRAWERANGELPETASAVTGSGGVHLLFRAAGEVRPSVNAALAVDVRGDGSYIVAPPSVHPNGRRYEWEVPPDEEAPARYEGLPEAFAAHVRPRGGGAGAGRYEMPATVCEGGRNDALFRLGASLRAKRVDPVAIADAVRGVNAARCSPPLPPDEVDRVVESVLALPEGRSEAFERERAARLPATTAKAKEVEAEPVERPAWLDRSGRVRHNLFGQMIAESRHVCHVGKPDGVLAVWDGARYALGPDEVDRACIEVYDSIRGRERVEVREYIRLTAPVREEAPSRLLAFKNGVLDVYTGDFRPMTPELLISNVIPHDYDPDARTDGAVGRLLDRLACGDPDIKLNLMECMGMAMHRSAEFAQCAVLTGTGSNGKSVFSRMLQALVGEDNCSALDIASLKRPFQAGHLAGKLLNVGDDIPNGFLDGDALATFKSVVSGDTVFTDVKNGAGYAFRPYALFVVSCNEFPRIGDTTQGTLRRLHGIPFNARFSRSDPDFNPRIADEMTTEEACREMVALGLAGLQSAIAHGGFTPTGYSEDIVADIVTDSDTVAAWAEDTGAAAWAPGMAVTEVYARYSDWCGGAGVSAVSRKRFTRRANALMGTFVDSRRNAEHKSVKVFLTK